MMNVLKLIIIAKGCCELMKNLLINDIIQYNVKLIIMPV